MATNSHGIEQPQVTPRCLKCDILVPSYEAWAAWDCEKANLITYSYVIDLVTTQETMAVYNPGHQIGSWKPYPWEPEGEE